MVKDKSNRIWIVIDRKGDELYATWKCHNDSFYSWIDKKIFLY